MNLIDPAGENPSIENPVPKLATTPGMKLLRKLNLRDAPAALADPANRAAIAHAAAGLAASLIPAPPNDIAAMIRRLAWHYPQPARSSEARKAIAEDWLADLAHLPADIIDAACIEWRRGPHEYAPSPGQLLARANPIWEHRRALARRAETFLAELHAPPGQDEITDPTESLRASKKKPSRRLPPQRTAISRANTRFERRETGAVR